METGSGRAGLWPSARGRSEARGCRRGGLEKPQRGALGCWRRSRQPRGNWSGLSGLGAAEAAGRRMRGVNARAARVSQPEPPRADIATAYRGLVGCRAPGRLSAEAAGSRALAAGFTGAPARARPRERRVRSGTLKGVRPQAWRAPAARSGARACPARAARRGREAASGL
ncbi:unnamed protein product [Miscanthus lutarioriparius]|uniref:Uncharacterized protein n=1 Tax=Miscanthus lutarioriparius TaxID=422564 RepID=A0A811S7G5_9POAL|nr:unnamed protein product [Miscanthus lutarioriparius]